MKKSLLFFLVIAIAMTSVFVGCTHKDPKATEGPTATPQRDENTCVVWWDNDAKDQELIADAWYDFKAANSGEGGKYSDKITMFTTPGDAGGTTTLELQIAGGTAPDLIRMDHVYVTALGQEGNVLDLNAKYGATETLSKDFSESAWGAVTYKDAVYGIPFDANTIVFGAKTADLEAAGVSLPTTWDELIEYGGKIKALNLDHNVYTIPSVSDTRYNWPAFFFMFWVWRLGGDVLNEDMTEAIFNDTETGVKALQMMLQLKSSGLISSEAYEETQTSMGDYGTWHLNNADAIDGVEFGLLPALMEGGERYSGLGLYALSVVTTSQNPDLAYDFAVHFATQKNSLTDEYYLYRYCKNHSFIPSYLPATEDDYYAADNSSAFWKVAVEQMGKTKYRPAVPCWPQIEEELSKAVLSVLRDGVDPTEALNSAAKSANEMLKEYAN